MKINHEKCSAYLYEEYRKKYPECGKLQKRAEQVLIDGGSHAIRLSEPYPPRIVKASGSGVVTADGNRVLDFWQGHHANILGHNPPLITEALAAFFADGNGLQTGFTDELQAECGEILCRAVGLEAVRFTTSGSLATMYATLLARAFTGRNLVMKIGGGWHGAQPWGLKGIDYHGLTSIFNEIDTAGLPTIFADEVLVTAFNDPEMLQRQFSRHGDSIACLILEPFIGAGGFIASSREYIELARKLTENYGALLIFDEVINGFRFCPGSIGELYGVRPDLAAYGKIIGGGMPVSAVAGGREVLSLAGKQGKRKVRFSGGTYSGHPASLLAAKTMMTYLLSHTDEIYPAINRLGEEARRGAEQAFRREGIYAYCTGRGNEAVPGSSLGMVFFPYREGEKITSPEAGRNENLCDTVVGERLLQTALLLEDVHVVHGFGSISAAHSEDDVRKFIEACGKTARLFASFRR
jgi:glutamate-1-semialdehyde 2,1-aminomutase